MDNDVPDIYLSGLTLTELETLDLFDEPYRARQVFSWVQKSVANFDAMTNLPVSERQKLQARYGNLRSSNVSHELVDPDGSLKLQIRLRDGSAVECVLLEDIEGRKTACLSSQVGCPMGCTFCRTGQLGFLRNLGADEILEQYHFLRERRGFISNVVFMGMGEPMLNLGAVRAAINVLNHPDGIKMSLRKITISTSGVVPGILDMAENGPRVRLAVSLTTANEVLRSEMMPVNRTWNLASLKNALMEYQHITNDRITLEVVLTGNRNSGRDDAEALVRWIRPLRAQVNLIPWNSVPSLPYIEATPQQLRAFESVLSDNGILTVRRMHRGRGVMGACGQLGDTLRSD
jgi:23S rRNA (adenine2503-C2)-methyltransferase